MRKTLYGVASALLVSSVVVGGAFAQTAPNDPRLDGIEKLENGALQQAARLNKAAVANSELGCGLSDRQFAEKVLRGASSDAAFLINSIRLVGSDGVDYSGGAFNEISGKLSQHNGQRTDISGLQAIAVRAQCAMRAGGNLLSSIRVPPQTFSRTGADVELRVVLGYVSSIEYVFNGERLTDDLSSAGLSASEVRAIKRVKSQFNALLGDEYEDDSALERAVLLASRIPGVSLRPTLKKSDGGKPGAVSLSVDIFNFDAYRGDVTLLNYSPESLGRWGPLLQLAAHSQVLPGDEINLSGYSSTNFKSQNVIRLSYDAPIGGSNVIAGVYGSYGRSEPGGELSDIELKTESFIFGGQASYPVKVGTGFQADIYGGAEIIEQNLDVVGTQISNDKLSIGYAGVEGYWSHGAIFSGYDFEIRKGVSAFGASKTGDIDISRIGANPQALVGRFNLDTKMSMGEYLQFHNRFSGQYSKDPLLAYEEFAVGNFTIGRGYEPGLLSGDSGIGGALDLIFGPFSMGGAGSSGVSFDISPYGFYDFVEVWNEDQFGENSGPLVSFGAGAKIGVTKDLSIDLTYAYARDKVFSFSAEAPGGSYLVRTSFKF